MRKNIIQKVLALVLTIVALAMGQQAQAAMKTVTYTITSVELNSGTNNYDIVFTRSGDAPFDASATTYTTSVHKSSIGQSPGYPGYIHVELADVFELSVSWDSGSNVTFNNNCIPIEYKVYSLGIQGVFDLQTRCIW